MHWHTLFQRFKADGLSLYYFVGMEDLLLPQSRSRNKSLQMYLEVVRVYSRSNGDLHIVTKGEKPFPTVFNFLHIVSPGEFVSMHVYIINFWKFYKVTHFIWRDTWWMRGMLETCWLWRSDRNDWPMVNSDSDIADRSHCRVSSYYGMIALMIKRKGGTERRDMPSYTHVYLLIYVYVCYCWCLVNDDDDEEGKRETMTSPAWGLNSSLHPRTSADSWGNWWLPSNVRKHSRAIKRGGENTDNNALEKWWYMA